MSNISKVVLLTGLLILTFYSNAKILAENGGNYLLSKDQDEQQIVDIPSSKIYKVSVYAAIEDTPVHKSINVKKNGNLIKAGGTNLQIADSGSALIQAKKISVVKQSDSYLIGGNYNIEEANPSTAIQGIFTLTKFNQNILIADLDKSSLIRVDIQSIKSNVIGENPSFKFQITTDGKKYFPITGDSSIDVYGKNVSMRIISWPQEAIWINVYGNYSVLFNHSSDE